MTKDKFYLLTLKYLNKYYIDPDKVGNKFSVWSQSLESTDYK